jgi:hypothetical protein
MARLNGIDYVLWIVTILVLFLFYLWVGNFGRLDFLAPSPISTYVQNLWGATYIASGIIFSVFMGSIIFLAAKFRMRRTTVSIGVEEARRLNNYYALALALNIVAGIFVTYEIFQLTSGSINSLLQNQFLIGLTIAADLMVFASIIYLVYKQYFQD